MKKKRIVKLEPQTVELFAEVLSKLRPPPPLTVSQWADRYRVLSAESSAEPGRWHTEKAPYQRAIMDAIGDPHVRSVVVMSAAQIGKTDAFILNPLGYYMDYAPCPVMCMQPTLDMGQTLSKDRIAPMIRDTPRLTGLVDTKSRYAGNTVMKKNFPGGHITIVGANSPSSLASRPIKVLLADEIDRYPKSAGTEGDPLDLAKKRQTTFWDYKTVMVSTPTIKGDSRIEDAYLLSTQEEWNVPCPECGAWGSIGSFAGLVFTVSSWRVLTPDNISGSTSSNWATHSVIGGKDKSEYVSPGLREYQFNITLSSRLGVNPRKVFDALMDLCEAGAVDYFIINNRPVSQNPFMLEKVADEWGAVHRFWGLTSGKLTLTLKEYT